MSPTEEADLRGLVAEVLTGKAIGRRSKNDWTPTFITQPWDADYLVDAVLAVLVEHPDKVLDLLARRAMTEHRAEPLDTNKEST